MSCGQKLIVRDAVYGVRYFMMKDKPISSNAVQENWCQRSRTLSRSVASARRCAAGGMAMAMAAAYACTRGVDENAVDNIE